MIIQAWRYIEKLIQALRCNPVSLLVELRRPTRVLPCHQYFPNCQYNLIGWKKIDTLRYWENNNKLFGIDTRRSKNRPTAGVASIRNEIAHIYGGKNKFILPPCSTALLSFSSACFIVIFHILLFPSDRRICAMREWAIYVNVLRYYFRLFDSRTWCRRSWNARFDWWDCYHRSTKRCLALFRVLTLVSINHFFCVYACYDYTYVFLF